MHQSLSRVASSVRQNGLLRTITLVPKNIRHYLTDFDRIHGTDTRHEPGTDQSLPQGHVGYEASKSTLLPRIIDSLDINPENYTFIDLGSGKGRVLLLASHFPFHRVIGVEFDRRLHHIAEDNARRYRPSGRRVERIETVCADAGDYTLPAGNLLLFMYNPFHGKIMQRVLNNIASALTEQPRQLRVVYHNPVERQQLDEAPCLQRISDREYTIGKLRRRSIGRVALYRQSDDSL